MLQSDGQSLDGICLWRTYCKVVLFPPKRWCVLLGFFVSQIGDSQTMPTSKWESHIKWTEPQGRDCCTGVRRTIGPGEPHRACQHAGQAPGETAHLRVWFAGTRVLQRRGQLDSSGGYLQPHRSLRWALRVRAVRSFQLRVLFSACRFVLHWLRDRCSSDATRFQDPCSFRHKHISHSNCSRRHSTETLIRMEGPALLLCCSVEQTSGSSNVSDGFKTTIWQHLDWQSMKREWIHSYWEQFTYWNRFFFTATWAFTHSSLRGLPQTGNGACTFSVLVWILDICWLIDKLCRQWHDQFTPLWHPWMSKSCIHASDFSNSIAKFRNAAISTILDTDTVISMCSVWTWI